MKFAIVGAGAIGAFAGAMLSRTGEDVALVARGAHLRAMKEHGVRVRGSLGEFEARPVVTDDFNSIGPVDVVLLTVKAHSLTEIAPRLGPLLGNATSIVTAQNGIPWWYFLRHGGEWEGTQLETVDPGGIIAKHIEVERVIGCVVYCSTILPEPGIVEHIEGTRFSIGELDGQKSARCQAIAEVLNRAGLKSPIRNNIRHDIWVKLMGNVALNPISALTRATILEILQYPETRAVTSEIMHETERVARALGIDVGITVEQRLAGAERVGHHKTSMLQDVETGRPLELGPIVGAVVELGGKLGIPTPYTKAVYSCTKLLEQSLKGGRLTSDDQPRPR